MAQAMSAPSPTWAWSGWPSQTHGASTRSSGWSTPASSTANGRASTRPSSMRKRWVTSGTIPSACAAANDSAGLTSLSSGARPWWLASPSVTATATWWAPSDMSLATVPPAPRISSSGWGATTTTRPEQAAARDATASPSAGWVRRARPIPVFQLPRGPSRTRRQRSQDPRLLPVDQVRAEPFEVSLGVVLPDVHQEIGDCLGVLLVEGERRRTERTTRPIDDGDGIGRNRRAHGARDDGRRRAGVTVELSCGPLKKGLILSQRRVHCTEMCPSMRIGAQWTAPEGIGHRHGASVPTRCDADSTRPESRTIQVCTDVAHRRYRHIAERDRSGVGARHADPDPGSRLERHAGLAESDRKELLSGCGRRVDQRMRHQTRP